MSSEISRISESTGRLSSPEILCDGGASSTGTVANGFRGWVGLAGLAGVVELGRFGGSGAMGRRRIVSLSEGMPFLPRAEFFQWFDMGD